MKYALSVQNPISYLICMGIKTVENRTWKTDYRGRLYIHSSGGRDFYTLDDFPYPENLITLSDEFSSLVDKIGKELKITDEEDSIAVVQKLKASTKYSKYVEACIFLDKMATYEESLQRFYGYNLYKEDADEKYKERAIKAVKAKGCYHKNFAIIGHVDLVDIVQDSKSVWAEPNNYHWILENSVLYEKPVINVKGKLRLFDVSHIDMPDD